MASKATINGKRLYISQLSKQISTSDPPVKTSNPDVAVTAPLATALPTATECVPAATVPTAVPVPVPALIPASKGASKNTVISQKEVAPTTRIVVVRTKSSTKNENGDEVDPKIIEKGNNVELPALLTDGRTSVYLIRRPIPPAEPLKTTEIFKQPKDSQGTSRKPTRKTTTAGQNSNDVSTISTGDDFVSPPSRDYTPPTTSRTPRIRSSQLRSNSPSYESSHPGTGNNLVHFDIPATNARRSRSRGRSRSRPTSSILHRSSSKPRSPSPTSYRDELKLVPSSLPSSPDSKEQEYRTVQYLRPKIVKPDQQKQTAGQRTRSGKSFASVNPEDQTIAQSRREAGRPVTRQPISNKRTRFEDEDERPPEKEPTDPFYCQKCLRCMSRHICLVVIICLIIFIIGLAGAGVSIYFLASDSSTESAAKIVGIVLGVLVAIGALCFLYTVLTCVGSCVGYFTFNGEGPRGKSRAFGLIPPSQSKDRLYVPHDSTDLKESHRSSPVNSVSPVSTTAVQPVTRQKTVINETINVPNGKNITIEMPERLLIAGRMSPATHERSLNKVVKNIGHVVQDASKRYKGEMPSKVVVQVDPDAKVVV